MPLTSLTDAISLARGRGGGLAAFNVIVLEHAEAYVMAAEETGLPVVLQISENCVKYHGSLRPLAVATLALAEQCRAPVVVHLDHAEDVALVREGLRLGFSSVMYDGSRLADSDNRRQTAQVVTEAHALGISVEAELGEVGGKDGVHAPGVRTDPDDAAKFVTDTRVDALAVAVGSSHAMLERSAALDVSLIERLAESVPVPLVLHGSSGVPDHGLQEAVRCGMAKINIATHLNKVFTGALSRSLTETGKVDPRVYLRAAREATAAEAARLQRLLADPSGPPAAAPGP